MSEIFSTYTFVQMTICSLFCCPFTNVCLEKYVITEVEDKFC